MHITEKDVFFLNALKFSLAPSLQEGPFQVMFAGTYRGGKGTEYARA